MSAQDTDLERRVLAHERILQGLISHMVESDPVVLERLRDTFTRRAPIPSLIPGYVDTATYAARFVREVIRLGEEGKGQAHTSLLSKWDDLWPTVGEADLRNANIPVWFEVVKSGDLWEVTCNGRLTGGYISETGAREAAQAAAQDIFSSGGCAEINFPSGQGE